MERNLRMVKEMQIEQKKAGMCVYTPGGVNCSDTSKCARCGWNPEEQERRKARIDAGERPLKMGGVK